MVSNQASTNQGEANERPRRFSDELLQGIVDAIPDMVWVKDVEELRFVMFNKAAEDLLSVSRHQLLGKSDYDLFPKEQADAFVARDREVLASGCPIGTEEEEILRTPNGVRILSTKRRVILGGGKPKYILGIAHDITDRVEQDREQLLRQVEDAQKIEAIGVIAGKFSHDLNNMLAVILMAGQALIASLGDAPSLREDAEEIVEAAHRAAEMTRQLRVLSRR
jgi:PAS domain S-box-containing protein